MKSKHIVQVLFVIITGISCSNNIEKNRNKTLQNEHDEIVFESAENQELFRIIKEKDSLLFQIGFNQIDTLQVADLTSEDFEFYHDEHGITNSKAGFINNINGIRDLPFKTWRILVKGSTEIFPLYKDNSQVLYGAIQNGVHDFYQQNEGEKVRKTNTAKFTHLWIIEDSDWKLKRVLSFDHSVPNENAVDDKK
jgi:hypothetical protein